MDNYTRTLSIIWKNPLSTIKVLHLHVQHDPLQDVHLPKHLLNK